MRFVVLGVALCSVTAATAATAAQQQQPQLIERAGWLAGCWESRAPGRLTVEMWMPPAGALMVGGSRTVIGAAAREFEHLRIRGDAARLVYIALPSGQRETEFPSTHVSDTVLVFENPAHDFPQRIRYRRHGADSLLARVEGPGPNNATRGIDIRMRRVDCTSIAPPPPPDTLLIDATPSPDGQSLLVVKAVAANWDVYLADADGGRARSLTDHAGVDYQPAWSPDGSRIAFVSVRDGHQEINTMRADGSGVAQLTRGTVHNSEPAWSPDGKTIAFRSERDRPARIYLMAADGSGQRPLMRDSAASSAPAWSPNGRSLLFASNRSGRSEIYVTNADGSAPPQQLTQSPAGHSGLAEWSPDGNKIAFWTSRDGNDEVYVMNADGTNPINLTKHPARELVLGWTRGGGHILFRSSRDRAGFEIYRMRADGTGVQRLTRTQ